MNVKDIDGDLIDVDLRDGYIEIIIDDSSGCAPLDKDNAIKLADAIYKHFGVKR